MEQTIKKNIKKISLLQAHNFCLYYPSATLQVSIIYRNIATHKRKLYFGIEIMWYTSEQHIKKKSKLFQTECLDESVFKLQKALVRKTGSNLQISQTLAHRYTDCLQKPGFFKEQNAGFSAQIPRVSLTKTWFSKTGMLSLLYNNCSATMQGATCPSSEAVPQSYCSIDSSHSAFYIK